MSDQTNKALRLSELTGNVHAPKRRVRVRAIRARFDNAETTDENRNHWAYADNLSADSLASESVRQKLASRCRYEVRNNSWAKGIRDTLANDCIGTGPRLQMLTGNKALNQEIEADFWAWSEEIGLAEKLRIMRAARVDAGEVFGLMGTNKRLTHDVKLDVKLAETEQVTDPSLVATEPRRREGIEYDEAGNPLVYHVLKDHPGSLYGWTAYFAPEEFETWPAASVLHYFRPERPGQSRGIPDLTPAIDQFAELRRYSKAVIAAAEAVADHALVIYSDAPPDPDAAEDNAVEAMDTLELTRRMATTLPQGWKLGQVEAEQPTTTYDTFVKSKLGEIARCLGVPLIVAGLDARDANMSSAYIVGQKYVRTISVDRADLERLLNRLLDAWLTEWMRIDTTRRENLPPRISRTWQWDEIADHADPMKVANARSTELSAGTTSIPREYARKGLDWEEEQEADARSMGIPVAELRKLILQKRFGPVPAPPAPPAPPTDKPEPDTETDDEDDEEAPPEE